MPRPAVLLCGGQGFLGQYVVDELTRQGYSVAVMSPSLTAPAQSSTSPFVKYVPGNIATGEGLLEALFAAAMMGHDRSQPHGPGAGLAAVVNCAALSSPAECERDPVKSKAVNVPQVSFDGLFIFFFIFYKKKKEQKLTFSSISSSISVLKKTTSTRCSGAR